MNVTKIELAFIIIFAFYIGLNFAFNPYKLNDIQQVDYYNRLADAFFNGRTDVYSKQIQDLSWYHNKYYLYWGPAPILFVLPFYLSLVFRSDAFYTLIAALINSFLFYQVIKNVKLYFKLDTSDFDLGFLLLNFALASPAYYLGIAGRIWHTSQTIATLYSLATLLCIFLFLRYKKMRYMILTAVFFNLTWLSRYSLILNGLFLLFPAIMLYQAKEKKLLIRSIVSFLAIFLLFFAVFGYYNYIRFGNPLETGNRYQLTAPRYSKVQHAGKLFSLSNVGYNAYYYFLHAPFKVTPPFLKFDLEGNSIFAMYPLFLVYFFMRKKIVAKSNRVFLLFIIAGATILLNTFALLLLPFTGWRQLGSRYILDVVPLAFMLPIFIVPSLSKRIKISLLIYGILINLIGLLAFYT